ncbi:MAG: methyltransferase domain-containing protein [bacterium]
MKFYTNLFIFSLLLLLNIQTHATTSINNLQNLSEEQSKTCINFFNAFKNTQAKKFVKQIIRENYSAGTCNYHPQKNNLDSDSINSKCETFVNTLFSELTTIQNTPEKLFPLMQKMSRKTIPQNPIWFKELSQAYEHYKRTYRAQMDNAILSPFIAQTSSLVDIGCGGGDFVALLKQTNTQLQKVAGIDILDWRTPGLDIDYHVVDFSKEGAKSPAQYDTGLLITVLHHVSENRDNIKLFLNNAKTAVSKRLIVLEDVIVQEQDLAHPKVSQAQALNKKLTQPHFSTFLKFDQETQKAVISLIDLLANSLSVGIPEMPFPFGFKPISEWVKIFKECNFEIEHIEILGFIDKKFNQTSQAIFVLNIL